MDVIRSAAATSAWGTYLHVLLGFCTPLETTLRAATCNSLNDTFSDSSSVRPAILSGSGPVWMVMARFTGVRLREPLLHFCISIGKGGKFRSGALRTSSAGSLLSGCGLERLLGTGIHRGITPC